MTINTPLLAGEWANFRGVKSFRTVGSDGLLVELSYDDTSEVVQLASASQLTMLQRYVEHGRHRPQPHYINHSRDEKAGTWVNLRGAVSWSDGLRFDNSSDRILYLTYEDGGLDAVCFSMDQARDVMVQLPKS